MNSEKSKTNKKWVSNKKYRDNYGKIFGKVEETPCNGSEYLKKFQPIPR